MHVFLLTDRALYQFIEIFALQFRARQTANLVFVDDLKPETRCMSKVDFFVPDLFRMNQHLEDQRRSAD